MLNVIVQSSTVDKGPNPRGVEKHLKKTNDISYDKEEFGFLNSLPSFFFFQWDTPESLKTYYILSLFHKIV